MLPVRLVTARVGETLPGGVGGYPDHTLTKNRPGAGGYPDDILTERHATNRA